MGFRRRYRGGEMNETAFVILMVLAGFISWGATWVGLILFYVWEALNRPPTKRKLVQKPQAVELDDPKHPIALDELDDLMQRYLKYLKQEVSITEMDSQLRRVGFVTSEGLVDWKRFRRMAQERGHLPASQSSSETSKYRHGPRGGVYTWELSSKTGRMYKRYL